MEPHADAAAGDAAQAAEAAIPTAGRTITGVLPASAVAVIGIPLLAWFVPQDAAQQGTPWELLVILAALGLILFVHHFAQAPRPQLDKGIGRAQWRRALAAAARSGLLPPHPDVRTAAGVIACNIVEGFMMMSAVLLGIIFAGLVRPELSWLTCSGGVVAGVIVYAFRLRRSWSYLRVLHGQFPADR